MEDDIMINSNKRGKDSKSLPLKKETPATPKKSQPARGRNLGKSPRELQLRARAIAQHIIAGSSQQDALIAAGYSPNTARSQGQAILGNPRMRQTIDQCLDKAGLSDNDISQRLRQLADATKPTYVSHNGKITDERADPDNPTRLASVALAAKLRGLLVDRSVNVQVRLEVQPVDLSRYGRKRLALESDSTSAIGGCPVTGSTLLPILDPCGEAV